jgi:hypothetical protein
VSAIQDIRAILKEDILPLFKAVPLRADKIEKRIDELRSSYKYNGNFYNDLKDGAWLEKIEKPGLMLSLYLKRKWLKEAKFNISYNHTNIMYMRFELIKKWISKKDLGYINSLTRKDRYENDQEAGNQEFMEYMEKK